MDTQNGWLLNTIPSIKASQQCLLATVVRLQCHQYWMKWAVGSSPIRVWLDTEIRTFKTSARDCHGCIAVGLFSPLKEDFFAGSVEGRKKCKGTVLKGSMLCWKSTIKV
ncbi:hypothetical protein CEXT_213621 [Caerostris extrusa]|uniref:Uncharacterized protein n=1 Tax=Caerostris extrusa TaxID=172846 RepID=A0AAV4MBA7_CAEEX|nr:hypothetical protein CEXT_213621 [Caerostris extrusa]